MHPAPVAVVYVVVDVFVVVFVFGNVRMRLPRSCAFAAFADVRGMDGSRFIKNPPDPGTTGTKRTKLSAQDPFRHMGIEDPPGAGREKPLPVAL